MEVTEKCSNSELWHACASGMMQMPTVNSKVFYFPQVHEEHTLTTVDFRGLLRIPTMILCRVGVVQYLGNCIGQRFEETHEEAQCPKTLDVGQAWWCFFIGNFHHGCDEGKKLSDELLSTKDCAHKYAERLTKIYVHIQR